jgi:hypothetical protein
MSNEGKKPVWISTEAHEALRLYCDQSGRTQVDVVSDLVYRVVQPELERLRAEAPNGVLETKSAARKPKK